MLRLILCASTILFCVLSASAADSIDQPSPATDAEIAPMPVLQDGTNVELKSIPDFVQRVFVPILPRSTNVFRIVDEPVEELLDVPAGFSLHKNLGGLTIVAEPGAVAGYVRIRTESRELTLSLAVLEPYSNVRSGRLNGYEIGHYVEAPMKGLDSYRVPDGFVPLTAETEELWVSDHYRLRDFQCKLDGDSKFLVLRPEALLKLELLQRRLNLEGLSFKRFTVMSAFRTPYYNARIGNDTVYSRHVYGDAMDIYVDEDRDGGMDDVNRDGVINQEDARHLLRVAEEIDHSKDWGWLKGGAGVYRANSAHGPFLHIDVRGYVARWGA